jgi:succinate-semialdehyde dehydrogenase/glutarate-semialdehyde dehydrogenase
MAYQSVNPNNGKVLKSFDKLTDEQLEKSIVTAESCFETWKHTSYAQRAEIVSKAAALLRANVDEFAKLATLEMGKRIDEARGEVKFSADILAYYAEHAKTFLAPIIRRSARLTWKTARSACSSVWNRGIFRTISLRASLDRN